MKNKYAEAFEINLVCQQCLEVLKKNCNLLYFTIYKKINQFINVIDETKMIPRKLKGVIFLTQTQHNNIHKTVFHTKNPEYNSIVLMNLEKNIKIFHLIFVLEKRKQ